jgi:hypothetical protein
VSRKHFEGWLCSIEQGVVRGRKIDVEVDVEGPSIRETDHLWRR